MSSLHEILKSHPVISLRSEVSRANIHGFNKMTKAQLIQVMLQYPERFSHMTMLEKIKRRKGDRQGRPMRVPPSEQVLGARKPRKQRVPAQEKKQAEQVQLLLTEVKKLKSTT